MHYKITCTTPIDRFEMLRFLAVTIGLGVGIQLLAIRVGLKGTGNLLLLGAMWAPAAGALLAGPATRRMVRESLRWPGWVWSLVGIAVGMLPTILKTALLALSGTGHWDSQHFPLVADGGGIAGVHSVSMLLGVGAQSWVCFGLNLALTLIVASVVLGAVGGLGEELGWRAVLQPASQARWGPLAGTLVVAAIWAYWHLPVNLSGYNNPVHPALTAWIIFPLAVVGMSFIFAWARLRSGSVWPAALAHGANNVVGSGLLLKSDSWAADQWTGLAGMLLVGGICAAMMVRAEREEHGL